MRLMMPMSSLLAFLSSVPFYAPCLAQEARILVAEDAPKRVLIPSDRNNGSTIGAATPIGVGRMAVALGCGAKLASHI